MAVQAVIAGFSFASQSKYVIITMLKELDQECLCMKPMGIVLFLNRGMVNLEKPLEGI